VQRDGLTLDLDTQLLLRLGERNGPPRLADTAIEDARADFARAARAVAGPRIPLARVDETTVAGATGALRARLYVPAEDTGATIVYFHGGGWLLGDLDTHESPCRALAAGSGARVLGVDYRLAPEAPFPAAADDALAAFRDAASSAPDPDRVAVAGDSAGGHLAAVVAQGAAAGGGPAPAFQLLVYPVTDSAEAHPSRATFAHGFRLTKENMDHYETTFLGGADRRDPRVSPLHAEDLAGVAPALVVTAGFDPLRDEGEAYAERLRDAGVPALLRRHDGYIHGFFNMLGLGHGPARAVTEMAGVLRWALAVSDAPWRRAGAARSPRGPAGVPYTST